MCRRQTSFLYNVVFQYSLYRGRLQNSDLKKFIIDSNFVYGRPCVNFKLVRYYFGFKVEKFAIHNRIHV